MCTYFVYMKKHRELCLYTLYYFTIHNKCDEKRVYIPYKIICRRIELSLRYDDDDGEVFRAAAVVFSGLLVVALTLPFRFW